MNKKKERKINKKELLEIMLAQAKRIEELEQKLEKTQKKLDSKKLTIENSGSLAEATLKLNNVFEVAQETAEQYLLNIKEKCKRIEIETKKECQTKTEQMIKETEKQCQQREKEAEEKLKDIELKIKELNKTMTKKKEKATTKVKTTNNKKNKVSTKSEKEINNQTENIAKKTVNDEKVITDKVLVEKSIKPIKGRPIKTMKKGN